MIRLGNAPVSYGVFGTTIQGASSSDLLTSIAEAGYEGSELGPPGFFGSPQETADAFASRGLVAIGSYVPIHFALDDETVAQDLGRMRQTCAELAACGGGIAILADEGSEELLLNPARDWLDRSLALSDGLWQKVVPRVQVAVEIAREFGLECAFHPHISTYVESPWEVDRLLETTDVDLTLDIGHMKLAGADPTECLEVWRDRVRHIHIKDVDTGVIRQAKAEHRTDFDEWWAGVCTPLGQGDVDIDGFVSDLISGGYDGWLVVEQDRRPTAMSEYPAVADQQAGNRQWLAKLVARAGSSHAP
jgi:inosose dehydratase